MKRLNSKGFTLVEIMIVVAIIALLAAIAIPNLLRAKLSANDALAKATLRSISTAAESYGTANNGNYPPNVSSLTNPVSGPPYLNKNYCDGSTLSGYVYDCSGMSSTAYIVTATPAAVGSSGSTTYTIVTGGVLSP